MVDGCDTQTRADGYMLAQQELRELRVRLKLGQ